MNTVFIDEIYGFRLGRSTTMNLTIFNNFILKTFENKFQVDVIFTDFAKVFYRVQYNFFPKTLYKSGFGDPFLF